ncbi:Hypothetical predicted protein [Mytilus galloprovincialis]|uniref:Reverse transcriptase domain-containing protein n=1 Tax=Mytilus galloprovincialis TaxID=29158 RepID=A0A8B6GIP5_MYTGA|nr:Hypothetical predicted protein [Mytilus galloprovincialis]
MSLSGIIKQLKYINPNKATGHDLIPRRVLKETAEQIAPYLEIIFNKSIKLGTVLTDWLIGNVIPILKKGDKTDPVNYHPVSLTSVPCKIMEHIILRSIMNYLDNNKLLSQYQYGSRKNHPCQQQVIDTSEDLARIRDNKGQADILILDFSKAFDTVLHRYLVHKLRNKSIDKYTENWIDNWI